MVDKDNRSYPSGPGSYWTGPVISANGFVAPDFTVATVPDATLWEGVVIFVSDGNAGNPTLARSDGTDWISMATGVAITAA